MAEMTRQQMLQRAARSPEGKMLLEHLMQQAQGMLYNQDPLVFKGYMAATFVIKELSEKE